MQNGEAWDARSVIDQISARPRLAPDRMPVLSAILERLATSATEYMRKLCAPPMVFLAGQPRLVRSHEQLERDADCIAMLFTVPEWDNLILIGIDRAFVTLLMEALFGGDGSETTPDTSRPFSALEVRVARALMDHLAVALGDAFQPVSKITLIAERTETRLTAQTLGAKASDIVIAGLSVQLFGEEGRLTIYLPATSLARFRSQFERTPFGSPASDPIWTKQLETELGQTEVRIDAVLGTLAMTLGDIARLEVGQLLDLGVTPGALITLEGGSDRLFTGRLGQTNRSFAVTVEHRIVLGEPHEMQSSRPKGNS